MAKKNKYKVSKIVQYQKHVRIAERIKKQPDFLNQKTFPPGSFVEIDPN